MAKKITQLELEPFPQPEFVKVDYPVLLCHGYGSFASILREGPMHDVCMFLRSHGVPAIAPNIVPYAEIEVRAEAWREVIRSVLKQTQSSRINIVAHSMAGLDIRAMLFYFPDMVSIVERVISVSSPHQGTSLAELAAKTPDFLKENFMKFSDWIGNKMYPDMQSNTTGALKQLTRDYVQHTFNPKIGEPPVPFYSYSAACGKETEEPIQTALRGFNNWIYDHEGVNDGFISQQSAEFGTHLGTIPYSHSEQILLNISSEREKQVKQFWLEVMGLCRA